MEALTYLFAAYSIIFLIIFVYAYSIGSRQKALWRELQSLKDTIEEEKQTTTAQKTESPKSSFAEIEG
ncbi:MAG: CcmD family protein [Chloroflexi bacterium]|nr:CcmD family protein [Chloroflexota bacterium]